jgi:hypothetical protein
METTTYRAIKFESGDIIPAGVEVKVLPLRHKTERRRSHPSKCVVLYNGKEYGCKYTSVIEPPSEDVIEAMVYERTSCQSVNGVDNIEPDGFDPDGFPSWLQALGIS